MGFEDWMLEDGYGDEMEYMDYLERQYYKSCAKYIPSTNNRHKDKQVHNTFYSTCVQGTLEFIDSQHGVLCKGDDIYIKHLNQSYRRILLGQKQNKSRGSTTYF